MNLLNDPGPFFFYTRIKSEWSILFYFWGEVCTYVLVYLCVSVAISKRVYLATEINSAIRGGNKGGFILMDCHRKIPVKTILGPPPPFLYVCFDKSFPVPC